ncbi:MAG: hypothetical protein RLZZ428_1148, partial [Pseudomonadota bacterium]
MLLSEVVQFLDTLSPFALQEKWDNSGVNVGDLSREISQIVVSLDIDATMIENAQEGTLFVVHHPLIFGNLSALDFAKYPANLLEKMILKKQSLVAMHTNFDQTHLNRYVFEDILGFTCDTEEKFVCMAKGDWKYDQLITHIKHKLHLPVVKVVGQKEQIQSIALTTGSGASLIDEIEADCFLTGDIKYHDAMKAMSQNLMMVDIGHYESELYFAQIMAEKLKVLPLLVIIADSKNPFHI